MRQITQAIGVVTTALSPAVGLLALLVLIDCLAPSAAYAAGAQNLQGTGAYDAPEFANGAIRNVFCDLLSLVEGTFGGLLLTAAGFLAVGHAAFGDTRHATTIIPVGIGTFAMGAVISIYFGTMCGGGGGGGTPAAGRTYGIEATSTPISRALGFGEPAELEQVPAENTPTGDPFTDF
ncbi:MAG: hypothetical protein KDD69_09380 [Bdellovibrionales bacterium]|nr:hypothetical protein [Bdellovibrionales bacterium]